MSDLTVFLLLSLIPIYIGLTIFIEWLVGYISRKKFIKKILKKYDNYDTKELDEK